MPRAAAYFSGFSMLPQKTNMQKRSQSGFTLVEVAIALVIVGLLIGGIIKGQAMVKQAKIRKLEAMVEDIRTAVGAYYRMLGRLPGDANNDGWIETDDGFVDLVNQKLITGTANTMDPNSKVRKHPFGGDVSLKYNSTYGDNYVIITGLDADVIGQLDKKFDDGAGSSGLVRSSGSTLYMPL